MKPNEIRQIIEDRFNERLSEILGMSDKWGTIEISGVGSTGLSEAVEAERCQDQAEPRNTALPPNLNPVPVLAESPHCDERNEARESTQSREDTTVQPMRESRGGIQTPYECPECGRMHATFMDTARCKHYETITRT